MVARKLGEMSGQDAGSYLEPVDLGNGQFGYRDCGFWYYRNGSDGGFVRASNPSFQQELDIRYITRLVESGR